VRRVVHEKVQAASASRESPRHLLARREWSKYRRRKRKWKWFSIV